MEGIARIFKALSDETRLTIMGLVFRHGHLCVCEVEQILGITQSKASRHLRYLRGAGVLEAERDGLIVNYRLPTERDQEMAIVLATLRSLLVNRPLPDTATRLAQIRSTRQAEPPPPDLRTSEKAVQGRRLLAEEAPGRRLPKSSPGRGSVSRGELPKRSPPGKGEVGR